MSCHAAIVVGKKLQDLVILATRNTEKSSSKPQRKPLEQEEAAEQVVKAAKPPVQE